MAIQSAACPRCGASVQLQPQFPTATCTYCGLSFPKPASGAKVGAALPLGCILGGVALLVVVMGGSGAAFFALRGSKPSKSSTTTAGATPAAPGDPLGALQPGAAAPAGKDVHPPRLEGRQALFGDLNGDAVVDIVFPARVQEESGSKQRFIAFNGRTGAELWRSPEAEINGSIALEQGKLMVADRSGKLSAFDARSGAASWSVALGERLSEYCVASEPGAVRVVTADQRTVAVDAATGKQTPVAGKPPCKRANTSNRFGRRRDDFADRSDSRAPEGVKSVVCGGVRVMGDRNFTVADQCKAQFRVDPDKLPGMSPSALWQHAGGMLVFGSKRPGTRVPMVGFLKGGKLVWSSDVPASNPLEVSEGAPNHVALAGSRLFVAYEQQTGDKAPSITAFDTASGARLWNVTLPGGRKSLSRLEAGGDGLLVSVGDAAVGLAAADGKQRFVIGEMD
jgi:outer membrane protein assembly factor BamB